MLASQRKHNGLTFSDLGKLTVPVISTMTMDAYKKLSMKGKLSVEVHEGSYKYPHPESIITVWSYDFPSVEVCPTNKGYARNEIVIPGGLREAYEFFYSVTCMLDMKLKGL